jgi:hypothetical protein
VTSQIDIRAFVALRRGTGTQKSAGPGYTQGCSLVLPGDVVAREPAPHAGSGRGSGCSVSCQNHMFLAGFGRGPKALLQGEH